MCGVSAVVPSGVMPCWMQMETLIWTTRWTWPAMWRSCSAGLWPTSGAVSSPEPETWTCYTCYIQVFSILSKQSCHTCNFLLDCNYTEKCPVFNRQVHISLHYSSSILAAHWSFGGEQESKEPDLSVGKLNLLSRVSSEVRGWCQHPFPLNIFTQDCHVELGGCVNGIFIQNLALHSYVPDALLADMRETFAYKLTVDRLASLQILFIFLFLHIDLRVYKELILCWFWQPMCFP